jgi:hypothetical protein
MTASFLGQRHLRQRCSTSGLLLATLLIGLIDQRFLPRGRHLSSPFVRHCRACAAFLLVSQAGESGLKLLPPCSLSGEADLEAAAAKPKEDCCCGRRLSCLGSACIQKALATSSLLVKKLLTTGGLLAFIGGSLIEESLVTIGLLAFVGGTLVEELLAMIGLLAFVGSTLVEEALAMSCLLLFASSLLVNMAMAGCRLEAVALVLSQGVNCPLPILVGAFRTRASPKKDRLPGRFWRQQAGSLLVFEKCLLEPFLVAKGTTNIGWGNEF